MPWSSVTSRVFHQKTAFSFVVRRSNASVYIFERISNLSQPFLRVCDYRFASVKEPPLALNPHCDLCEFKQLCRAKAEEADNPYSP